MSAIITLTTDFGLADAYVAAMKGAILSINPGAKLVDICHSIRPQDILQAAFVLSTAYHFFPRGTIHLVVVDPGVGTERRAVVLRTPSADFIAPDNGVLSYILREHSAGLAANAARQVEPGPDAEAVAITNPRLWRSPLSPTFHGRDILAPVAAWLSLGRPLSDCGERITSLLMLPLTVPCQAGDGSLVGHIIHIDNFGNLITDISAADLAEDRRSASIEVGGQRISGLSRTYAEAEGLLALIGSSGYLEVSARGGSARALLDVRLGDEVRLRQLPPGSQ